LPSNINPLLQVMTGGVANPPEHVPLGILTPVVALLVMPGHDACLPHLLLARTKPVAVSHAVQDASLVHTAHPSGHLMQLPPLK
jgi:hypothetical protein